MKRSAFATLCGISKQMVSKYEAAGLIVVEGDVVDPAASLANLEGRLDEAKRAQALTLLEQISGVGAARTASTVARAAPSAKLQRDEIERDLKQLEYGRQSGQLVHVDDVAEQAAQAIAAMRETFAASKREIAAELCARFDIPADKVTAVARFLGDQFEIPIGRFAAIAGALAKDPDAAIIAQIDPAADADAKAAA